MKSKGLVIFLIFIAATAPSFGQLLKLQVDSSQAIADRIVKSEVPVLVDFWAVWCMPCRILNPILEDVSKHYGKKVLFVKVNVDIHRALSAYFGVSSIPMVFIIHRKNVVRAFPGVQPKELYIAALDSVLKSTSNSSDHKPATPPDSTQVVR